MLYVYIYIYIHVHDYALLTLKILPKGHHFALFFQIQGCFFQRHFDDCCWTYLTKRLSFSLRFRFWLFEMLSLIWSSFKSLKVRPWKSSRPNKEWFWRMIHVKDSRSYHGAKFGQLGLPGKIYSWFIVFNMVVLNRHLDRITQSLELIRLILAPYSRTPVRRYAVQFMLYNFSRYPPWNYHRTWKWMVGIQFSFWDGLFSGAMLVSGSVTLDNNNIMFDF